MKRWLWYGAVMVLIAAVSADSYAGFDVGQLQAVQTVRVTKQAGLTMIETDTGEHGVGMTLEGAFEDLEETLPFRLLLDTAEYLLIGQDCEELLPALLNYLRPSCGVCRAEGEADLAQAGRYLKLHTPELTLMQWRAGENHIPLLRTADGRMELVT